MALPTKTDLQTMDYSYGGVPFVSVATKAGIDLDTLDYSYAGVPFWGVEDGAAPPQAYDAIIATITTASDASSVTKSMVKSTTWREGTSGTWLTTNCTLKAGKVYQFRTPLSGMSSSATAVLPT